MPLDYAFFLLGCVELPEKRFDTFALVFRRHAEYTAEPHADYSYCDIQNNRGRCSALVEPVVDTGILKELFVKDP